MGYGYGRYCPCHLAAFGSLLYLSKTICRKLYAFRHKVGGSDMDVILMGTACAESGAERDNTYLLLREQSDCTLIDVGGNPLGKLKKMNIALDQVKRVVFTHFHIDHVYGFPSLLWGMWIGGRKEPLDVYCAESDSERLQAWIHVIGALKWPIDFEIRIHPYEWKKNSLIWQQGDSQLSVFPSKHSVPTVGVEYVHEGKILVYSSDTSVNSAINEFPVIDLLIHEATTAQRTIESHSNLKQIADFYDWNSIDNAVMVHLMEGEPYTEVWQGLPQQVRRKISFGEDLMILKLL
jgi:ribonuclease Z